MGQLEKCESKLKTQSTQIHQLTELKSNLEVQCKQSMTELKEIKFRFENSTSLIQHSCKANSLLKEEKESLEKILQDNAVKLKTMKSDYDQLKEKFASIETQANELRIDSEITSKKIIEYKKLNEILTNEKDNLSNVGDIFFISPHLQFNIGY